eukprot:14675421-Heterocapsa_arctica.AAC.2
MATWNVNTQTDHAQIEWHLQSSMNDKVRNKQHTLECKTESISRALTADKPSREKREGES